MINRTSDFKPIEDSNVYTYLQDKLGVTKYKEKYYHEVEFHVVNGDLNVVVVDNRKRWYEKLKCLRDTQYRDLK